MRNIVTSTLAGLAVMAALLTVELPTASAQEVKQLRWATSSVGSSGHRAKVNLMAVLNREMDQFNINVMPTPGAIATIRGYAMGEFDGYYGADIAFNELANNTGRFKGFRDQMEREPVQSFWAYTIEVGLAVRADDADSYDGWRSLAGRPLFTGPAPWDVRAQLERALNVLEVGHEYRELDLGLAGSSLANGSIDGFIAYTAGESAVSPWVAEARLAADTVILNPSDEEVEILRNAGLDVITVDPDAFQSDTGTSEVRLVPFFYGFHVGTEVSADDVYEMLLVIEEHAEELTKADKVFAQIEADMPSIQRRGVASAINDVKVHPGLARYMRERDVWNTEWDDRVAD
jgi:uncharacterized protein